MAFGDALLGIEQQLVPANTDFNQLLTDPTRIQPASVQNPQAPTVPTQLDESTPIQLSPDNVKRVKGIGKFFNTIGEVLADPATQKALSSIGIGLDPRGVGGALGQLGISLAEANARDEFRAAIAAGGDPNLVQVSGLSPEGRLTELEAFRQGQTLASEEEQRQIENQRADVALEQAQQRVDISRDALGLRRLDQLNTQRAQDIREAELENQRVLAERRLELDIEKTRIAAQRSRTQALIDQARLRALDREDEQAKLKEFEQVNKLRLDIAEATREELEELNTQLRVAEADLKRFESTSEPGFFKSFRSSNVREFEDGKAARQDVIDQLRNTIRDKESLVNEMTEDISTAITTFQGINPIGTGTSSAEGGQGTVPQLNLEQAKSFPENTPFRAPSGQVVVRRGQEFFPVPSQ